MKDRLDRIKKNEKNPVRIFRIDLGTAMVKPLKWRRQEEN